MIVRKNLTIGLVGFGVVGEGIYDVVNKTPNLQAKIKKICIKDLKKHRNAPLHLFTNDVNALIEDNEIDVIVELIDDAEAAYHIVKKSLKNGKSVISANKKLIANHLDELIELHREKDVSFLYEAAVCGSIPIIRNLEEYYDNDLLNSFLGIVNGSTNFILTQMNEEGLSYAKALQLAQEKGFAESDPSLDVEGIDAVNKLCIVLKHAYGIILTPEQLLHQGITKIKESDFAFAKTHGFGIKLLASAFRNEHNEITAFVLPTFVSKESQFYTVKNEYNAVLLGSTLADEQFLYGKGAGRYPTSSSVLSDISALSFDYRYEYRKSSFGEDYHFTNDNDILIYLSYPKNTQIELKTFSIQHEFHYHDQQIVVAKVKIAELINSNLLQNNDISIISLENIERLYFQNLN